MSEIDDYSIPCYLRSHGVDSYARQVEDMYAEIARLQADNDELDEQCTKRILEIYKLRAERGKLRRAAGIAYEVFIQERDNVPLAKRAVLPNGAIKILRAALAEKGE